MAFGDPLVGEPDVVVAPDMLAFAGIAPPKLRLYPVVSHIAEKLHAYTMPRSRPNSRVKDLPDIPLLAGTGAIDGMQLRLALERTFSFRATHELPDALPEPPSFWEAPYKAMAKADDLSWATLHNVHQVAATFLDPALGRGGLGHWDPIRWEWNDGPGSGTP